MVQTLESMRRRIESAEDLYSVVRVMKALSAARIRQSERAVESLADYNRTIEAGLQIVLGSRPEAIAANSPPDPRWAFIVFGSDQGMCGSFNEQVATFALEQIHALTPTAADRTVLVVGSRARDQLEDAGCTVVEQFLLPSSVGRINPAVQQVLLRVESLRFQQGISQFLLVHHRPSNPVGFRPSKLQLLPIDRDWLMSLATRDWNSRSAPTFTMDRRRLLSALIRQYLFVALYRAFAESLASENASRLSSMQAAEKNIQSHLSQLAVDYHQGRQQSITEELLDIVSAFETLTNEENQGARITGVNPGAETACDGKPGCGDAGGN